jgi:hypothetical protein
MTFKIKEGLAIAGQPFVDTNRSVTANSLTLNSNTSSTTTDTGSLIVTGGVGVSENVNVGGNLAVGGTFSITSQTGNVTIGSGNVTIEGNLTVNGTTTTINSTDLSVDDKNITLGAIANPDDVSGNGGGITLKAASDKTIIWVSSTDRWTSNVGFEASSIQNTPIGSSTASSGAFTSLTASGNASVTGTLGVTSVTTLTGALAANGGITVDTNKFIVADETGNTTIAGTLGVTGTITGSSTVSATQYTSTIATGTAPLVVTSTTLVTNLNADLIDGYSATTTNTASAVVVRDASKNIEFNNAVLSGSTSGTTTIQASAAASGTLTLPAVTDTVAAIAATQTLTNKTINLSSNTLSGTVAQFNTALSDADFSTTAGTETLTNKTINLANNTVSGTLAEFNTALSNADFASLAGSETLTNKTVALGSNTISGTLAQFNTALTDADFATLAGSETLTNKTIAAGSNTISGLTNTNLSGSAGITNANLANSAVTVGTTAISLGGTSTSLAGLTSVSSTGFTGALTGNASTATALATTRAFSLTGAVTATAVDFDGTGAVALSTVLADSGATAGTFTKVTITAKGIVTSGTTLAASDIPDLPASKITSGTFDTARIPTNITVSAATTATNADRLFHTDQDRNAGNYLPTYNDGQKVHWRFVSSTSAGTGGNYAGILHLAPWTGTTASTGDASYQMAVGSTATNGGGLPQLNIRKGIDSTWNAWQTILHSGNYNDYAPTKTGTGASGDWGINITGNAATVTNGVYTNTAQTISGIKTFSGNLAAWNTTTPGLGLGGIHLGAESATTDAGPAITFGARDSSSGGTSQAGIHVTSGGGFGTRMYFSTSDDYAVGSKVAMSIGANGAVSITRSDLTVAGDITVSGNQIFTAGVDARVKFATWTDTTYGIGMGASYTFGGFNTNYAMSFQMNDDAGRGFWWGDNVHTNAQGAMALSTNGKLTVAHSIRVGHGEGDVTIPGATHRLDVSGSIATSSGLFVGTNQVVNSDGNIRFDGTATTTNQNRGIYWTAYDKEGTTDPSDAAYIRHTTNVGGLAGSVLELSSQNDADDGINLVAASNAGVKVNGNTVWHAGNLSVGDGTLTVQGSNGLTGSGTFTANQSSAATVTISHADTSSQANVTNTGTTVIQSMQFDTYGHVTSVTSTTIATASIGRAIAMTLVFG